MNKAETQKRHGIVRKVWDFYIEGFRDMKLGKTLWLIILIKLFVFFIILRWLFFPDILRRDYSTDAERAEAVRKHLTSPSGSQTSQQTTIQII